MNQIDRMKILKMLGILVLIFAVVGFATNLRKKNSMTLEDYAALHPATESEADTEAPSDETDAEAADATAPVESENPAYDAPETDASGTEAPDDESLAAYTPSVLTGALLNGGADGRAMLDERVYCAAADGDASAEDFYSEPLSENLRRYITGISYPAANAAVNSQDATQAADPQDAPQDSAEPGAPLAITYDELRYLHILHYNFDGVPAEGELICNAAIAQDLLDIFYELYRNEYQLQKVLLIDEYNGDDTASMEDNNTSCFNYRTVEGSASLSKHALGLAIDINPLYNPYITYNADKSQNVSPAGGEDYADRSVNFPYKIDENDLCFKLFAEHGFIWGGNWNSVKDYQHFQKVPK